MIEFKDRIESAYDNVSAEKTIFGSVNKKWQLAIYVLWSTVPLALLYFFQEENEFPRSILIVSFIWIVLGFSAMIFWANTFAKKKLKLIGIQPPLGIFKFWVNQDYRELKLRKFGEELNQLGLLTGTSKDIELVDSYGDYFDNESKSLLKDGRVVLGGVILAFCIPVWNQFLTHFYKKNEAKLIDVTFLSAILVILIISFVGAAFQINKMYTDYSNKRSDKFKEISKLLKVLHLNLRLKYPGGDQAE